MAFIFKVESNSSFKQLNINNKGNQAALFTDTENMKYMLVLCFVHFMSLIKCPSFHPESILRIKLWCDLHKINSKYKSYKTVCLCIYGIDEVTLIQLILGKFSRHEVIEIEKERKESSLRSKVGVKIWS